MPDVTSTDINKNAKKAAYNGYAESLEQNETAKYANAESVFQNRHWNPCQVKIEILNKLEFFFLAYLNLS